MNPFIIFDVKGLDGISVQGEVQEFVTSSCDNIEAIGFILDDHNIVGIKVRFPAKTVIDKKLIDNTYQIVELFLASIIGELDVVANGYTLKTGQVYNPNLPPTEGPIIVSDIMMICDTLSVTCSYPLERYEKLFLALPIDNNTRDKILVFSNIMKIDNIAIRYLMQYEFLMSLVAPHRVQKEVTDFIRDTYNPTLAFNFIGFHPTRKPGKTFDEDDISYYRNILAHNDSSAIPDNFEKVIANMSKAATKVIFFALKQSR